MSEDNNSLGYASAPASGNSPSPSTSRVALTAADGLRQSADLLERPGAWTQGAYARDARGRAIWSGDRGAACWCIYGAINRVRARSVGADRALESVVKDPVAWNDTPGRTQAEVVAVLREAAARAARDAETLSGDECKQARSRDSDGANQ